MSAAAGSAPTPERPGASVQVEHVARRFEGRVDALRDVSLSIAPGEFVALTGPSGSGKSTLLQIIGSLDRPTSGRVVVDDISVADLRNPTDYRRHVVGFVFQLHHLLPILTARANVEVPMQASGVPRRERERRALELLAEVGLDHRADHVPSQLSGGERQRVAIARALANEPRLLLADEPTGALDSRSSERVLRLLAQTRERHGMTVLVVSYDPSIARFADRRLRLVDGMVVEGQEDVSDVPGHSPAAGG